MSHLRPSQVASAIDQMFGSNRSELNNDAITGVHRAQVHSLLTLLDQIPEELIQLPFNDYLEFVSCRGRLATALARWNVGDTGRIQPYHSKDPVERIRRLLLDCPDQLPEAKSDIPFVTDLGVRRTIQSKISAARIDDNAQEWLGATVFAGAALEALLLWAIKDASVLPPAQADKLVLRDLIKHAEAAGLIRPKTKQLAELAQDARNLIHPGRVARTGAECSKSTALASSAAVFAVIEELETKANP